MDGTRERALRGSAHEASGSRRGGPARGWAALGAGLVLLAGCGAGQEPVPVEDAVAHYDAAAGAVLAELPGAGWTLQENQRTVREVEGECRYSPGVWDAGAVLDGVSGAEGWDELSQRLDPVLAEHGFEPLGETERSGALHSVSSQDRHGAELVLDEQGRLSLRGALVDAEPCTVEALGL